MEYENNYSHILIRRFMGNDQAIGKYIGKPSVESIKRSIEKYDFLEITKEDAELCFGSGYENNLGVIYFVSKDL